MVASNQRRNPRSHGNMLLGPERKAKVGLLGVIFKWHPPRLRGYSQEKIREKRFVNKQNSMSEAPR